MHPRQHLKRKYHILDWIHIKSIYEGKKHKVFRIWIGTNILLRSDITWNNIFYQFMNEKSLSNVTLSWCIYVNIWDESIIFWIEYTLYQFMKEKKSLKNEQKYYLKQYILSFHGWKSPSNVTTLMYPRQHLWRKHHILDWIHIISVHEGKKLIKWNSTLMY